MRIHRLWEGDAPGALGNSPEDIPTLTEVSDSKPGEVRAAFVVCPGGAYAGLADYEGGPVAEFMESIGIKGLVLKYRLGPRYHHPAMQHDVQRAIQYVRARSSHLGVDQRRIGVLGFSAGGHLASTAVTYFQDAKPTSTDANNGDYVGVQSSRPDLGMLLYPVITMGPLGHAYSREMLLGKNPSQKDIDSMSSEKNVSLQTPPCFICHGANDQVVPIQNSLMFATALAEHKIPFELHVPEHGPHGFAMGTPGTPTDWRPAAQVWLRSHGFIV